MPWVKKKTKDKEEAPQAEATASAEPASSIAAAPAAAVAPPPPLALAPEEPKEEAKPPEDGLLSLFTEETGANEALLMITRTLPDVDIHELLEQTREVAALIHNRAA
ncbi:MAG: hypothetical protein FJ318_08425 [SAR202 cluster bacterium]|nr:hypothetical protein [SAR202 cluster bacterium]